MEKAFIAQRVANKLFAAENSIDVAVRDAAQLLDGMIEARQMLGVSAVLGAEAATEVTAAVNALVQARAAIVRAHNELAEAKLRIGVRTKLAGTVPKSLDHTVVGDRFDSAANS